VRRVLIVDDHEILRDGLRRILESSGEVEVVGEAGDGRAAVEAARRLQPDVTLMDVWLPGLSGIEATRALLSEDPRARVLILSTQERWSAVEEALRAGAAGYALKSAGSRELLRAIEAVASGRSYLSPSLASDAVHAILQPGSGPATPLASLTPREREVLQGIAAGRSAKEIAGDLHVSERTVETHRAALMRKLGVHKTGQLVRIAIREGLVEP
jgi:DNA-binding NarL/FixJ family response regulator